MTSTSQSPGEPGPIGSSDAAVGQFAAHSAAEQGHQTLTAQNWHRAKGTRNLLGVFVTFAGLVKLIVLRLRYHAGLTVLALSGIVLAVGLVTSASFFAQAVDQVMMRRELTEFSRITRRPPFSSQIFTPASRAVPLTYARAETLGADVADTLSSEVGLPVRSVIMTLNSGVMNLFPQANSESYDSDEDSSSSKGQRVNVVYMDQIQDHMDLLEGSPLDAQPSSGPLDVWLHSGLAEEIGAQIGDQFDLEGSEGAAPLRIAGVWNARDPQSSFWTNNPDQALRDVLLVRGQDYQSHVQPLLEIAVRTASWNVVLDEQDVLPANARSYMDGYGQAEQVIHQYLPDARLTKPSVPLGKFVSRQTTLTTLLLGFNVPALIILLYFLVLTSAVIAYWQRREMAILISRGITRVSILNFSLVEGLILFAIGFPLGMGFGILLARMMGNTNSFLAFVTREALPVSMRGFNLQLALITLVVVLGTKLWMTAQASNQTVVTQAREHARQSQAPFWYRYYVDLLLFVTAIYAYRQIALKGSLGALVQDRPADLYQDPLLVLVPALFTVSLAMVSMRFFPLTMRLLDWVAGFVPGTTIHLAMRQLGRQSQSYINPLLLVIVSLALGVYTLSMAGSLDQWLEDRIYYRVGTDLAFEPFLETGAMASPEGGSSGAAWIPDPDEFHNLDGVEAVARVGDYVTHIDDGMGDRIKGRFLGIDRIDFPQVSWFRRDLAAESLGGLMNLLAITPEGILVSQSFLEERGLRVGDRVRLQVLADLNASVNTDFIVVGTYENFPTVYEDEETVIGNLEYIFSFFGINMPHNIWIRVAEGTDPEAVFDEIPTMGIVAIGQQNSRAVLIEEQAKMERVGVFGTLSVGFLAATVMAALGLLTYSYASLHERRYVFGVLRAVGLKRGVIVGQVALEYTVLTVYGALAGVVIGLIATELFVPLFRVAPGQESPLPPLIPIIQESEIMMLVMVFVGLMILLEVVIISSALYRRVFESLRLGHQG